MFQSKQVKEYKPPNKILSWIDDYIVHPFRWRFKVAKRMWDYAMFGKDNYDWDSVHLFELMAFKLRRIYKRMYNGHVWQEPEDMEALKESIEICDRLRKCEYDDKYFEEHTAKWGELKHTFVPVDKKCSEWKTWRDSVTTPEQKEQEHKEFMECGEKGDRDRDADFDRLHFLLKTYSGSWWE